MGYRLGSAEPEPGRVDLVEVCCMQVDLILGIYLQDNAIGSVELNILIRCVHDPCNTFRLGLT